MTDDPASAAITYHANGQNLRGLNRDILRLALPSVAALIADPLLSFADTAMVGRLGVDELAALAIASSLFGAMYWLFNFLTSGTTAIVAQRYGARDFAGCGRVTVQALILAIIIGCLLAISGRLLAPFLYRIMGGHGRVAELGIAYFRWRVVAAPAVLVFFVGVGFLRGLQNPRLPLILAIVINVVNVVLDYGLIYGKLGLPALGVRGAALASVVAQGVAMLACLTLIFFSSYTRTYSMRSVTFSPRGLVHLLRISRDLFLRTGLLLLALVTTTAVAARIGTISLAAHQVGIQLWLLGALSIDGFAVAGQALIGKYLGSNLPQQAYRVGWLLLGWGVALGALLACFYAASGGWLFSLFTRDHEVLAAAGKILALIVIFQPINGVAFILDGVFIGASDTAFLRRMMTFGSLLLSIPLSLAALRFEWGLFGVWSALGALMVFRSATNLGRFMNRGWMREPPSLQP